MTFSISLFALAIVFLVLWVFAPKGWMTKVWALVWVIIEGASEMMQFLAQADWGVVLTDPQAFIVSLVCGLGVILARRRSDIRSM